MSRLDLLVHRSELGRALMWGCDTLKRKEVHEGCICLYCQLKRYDMEQEAKAIRKTFSVAVFVRHESHVLFVRHKLLNKWLPIGGEVEPNETPLEAAKREALEETGLADLTFAPCRLLSGSPDGFLGYEEHDAGPKGLHMCFSFLAECTTRKVVSDGSWEEHVWIDVRPDEKGLVLNPFLQIKEAYPEMERLQVSQIPFNVLQLITHVARVKAPS